MAQKRLELYGTLGPACQQEETLVKMFQAGMTGIRLNLSHVALADCGDWLARYFSAARRVGCAPQLLIDLQGPELRVGKLGAPVPLPQDGEVLLGEGGIPVPALILPALQPGQTVLLDDGALLLEVLSCDDHVARCRVVRGGLLQSRKSIALPGCNLRPPTLTQTDFENLSIAAQCGVTGVMQPFVRDREDLLALRQALRDAGASHIRCFAKLENRMGVQDLPEFLEEADEIIIARGDLGNDIPLYALPGVQKQVAALCRQSGKPFMVVTQLLHSMHHSAVPTRAEVSDIFNAVLDGASSLMLTGETAAGEYPVESMAWLSNTAHAALEFLAEG